MQQLLREKKKSMQQLLREMFKDNKKYQISDMIQNIIYFFNQPQIRDHIINLHINILPAGKKVQWDGTYFFDEKGNIDPYHHPGTNGISLTEFLKKQKAYTDNRASYVMSTCCITYEGNRVHFLSLIYNKKKRMLVFFDPGIHLYEKGQDLAVPIARDAFLKNGWIDSATNIERVGLCSTDYHGKKWGIQYDGNNPKTTKLPADSFCQSWTLYYLVEFLRNQCADTFFSTWCSVPPEKRETFMMMNFFMPHIQTNPFVFKEWQKFYPQGKLADLNNHVIKTFSQ
jgi:hypothetical protein